LALIAIAIESSREQNRSSIGLLARAVHELSPHGSGPQFSGGGGGGSRSPEQQSYYDMARKAVMLADACIKALNDPPEY
jgi:hypothetical protein